MTGPLSLDLMADVWSRRGSSIAVTTNVQRSDHPGRDVDVPAGVYVIDSSGSRLWRWNGVFRIEAVVDGRAVPAVVRSATPQVLVLDVDGPDMSTGNSGSAQRSLEVTFDGWDTLRIRSVGGIGVRLVETVLDPLDSAVAVPISATSWRLQMGEDAHFAVGAVCGRLSVEAPVVRTGPLAGAEPKIVQVTTVEGEAELALTMYRTGLDLVEPRRSFEECRDDVAHELAEFERRFPTLPVELATAGSRAAYTLWAATVRPTGVLRREAILMSKLWMNAVWSWDHCFNALGLASAHPQLAWDQFVLPFDHQDEFGALPDIVHDAGLMRGFVKPPVHGWALRRLLERMSPPREELLRIEVALDRWTAWWTTQRDVDGDGLCEYFHGCDSGQDNSTSFDMGFPALGPDLAAFLVVQLEVLADLADLRADAVTAARRRSEATALFDLLMERLWDGERFQVVHAHTGTTAAVSNSQIRFLPFVLGDRLPAEVRAVMSDDLDRSGLVTPYGLASESPASSAFEPDGYWRGAIWAPTNVLVVDGLRRSGLTAQADAIRHAFLGTVARSGVAENYDATDGRALRCPSYTWSAGAFWWLATAVDAPLVDIATEEG